MSDAAANVSKRKKVSAIWVVPIVAILLGAWMVVYTIRNQGPEITIAFDTAEGIEADKTKIKVRNVTVGIVESVGLGEDLESVVVHARVDNSARPLLRDDTQFWVVRPRIGKGGVSGLGTMLSGGYIQLAPGTGAPKQHHFTGLEDPPVTPVGTPGLNFKLIADRAGSVGAGDPILYEGFTVGRIETATFDVESQKMHYDAFIETPYDALVSSNTRFWNVSGVTFSATAGGIELDVGSLQTVLMGGVTFGLPEGVAKGAVVEPKTRFDIYRNYKAVNARPYRHALEFVARFDQSIRGLKPGAPVEYRGIPVGQVESLLLDEMMEAPEAGTAGRIAVLLRLEPGRLTLPDSQEGTKKLRENLERVVGNGLRASLSSGNLLTGSLYVALDVYPDEPAAEIGSFAGFPTLPTVAGGLEGIQHKVNTLLDKLNALPLDEVAQSAADAVAGMNDIVNSRGMQELPASINATLAELRSVLGSVAPGSPMQQRLLRTLTELERAIESMGSLLSTLDDKPSSVIFSREAPRDPEPQAGSK